MKRVLLYLGMSSCVSAEGKRSQVAHNNSSMKIVESSSFSTKNTVQSPVSASPGVQEEVFFNAKPWLDSDDEDFLSVDGEFTPYKTFDDKVGDQQGRKLSELFRESSFSSDSPTSQKANSEANGKDQKSATPTPINMTLGERRKKAGKSGHQRCLPSLVRSLSCGDRKKRLSPVHIAVAG